MSAKEGFLKMIENEKNTKIKQYEAEWLTFFNYSSKEDFYNYFKADEIEEAEFYSIVDCLYHQDCLFMLLEFMKKYESRLEEVKLEWISDSSFAKDFEERLNYAEGRLPEIPFFKEKRYGSSRSKKITYQ